MSGVAVGAVTIELLKWKLERHFLRSSANNVQMLKLEDCLATRPDWFWQDFILSYMLQQLTFFLLSIFFFSREAICNFLAADAIDPASESVENLWARGVLSRAL